MTRGFASSTECGVAGRPQQALEHVRLHYRSVTRDVNRNVRTTAEKDMKQGDVAREMVHTVIRRVRRNTTPRCCDVTDLHDVALGHAGVARRLLLLVLLRRVAVQRRRRRLVPRRRRQGRKLGATVRREKRVRRRLEGGRRRSVRSTHTHTHTHTHTPQIHPPTPQPAGTRNRGQVG